MKDFATEKTSMKYKGVKVTKEVGIDEDYIKVGISFDKGCFDTYRELTDEGDADKDVMRIIIKPAQKFFGRVELASIDSLDIEDLTRHGKVKFEYICSLYPYEKVHSKKSDPRDPKKPLKEAICSGITFKYLNSTYYQEFDPRRAKSQFIVAKSGLERMYSELKLI